MARRYQEVGISCLVDCFMPPEAAPKWQDAFTGINYQPVVLMADVEVALMRNAQREGTAKLREEQVRRQNEQFQGYRQTDVKIIDSTELSVSGLVKVLNKLIKTAKP